MDFDPPLGADGRSEARTEPEIPGEVYFSAGRSEGMGMLRDLSLGGAQVVGASDPPPTGAEVTLFFCAEKGGEPIRAPAEVVRHSQEGFAVQFKDASASVREALSTLMQTLASPEGAE